MKKILLSTAAFAVLTAVSCKKDDDNNNANRSQLIVGTWRYSFDAEDVNNNKMLDANERVPSTDTSTITFSSGGSGSASLSGFQIPFSWKLADNDQQIIVTNALTGTDTSYIHTLTANEFIIEDRTDNSYRWSGVVK